VVEQRPRHLAAKKADEKRSNCAMNYVFTGGGAGVPSRHFRWHISLPIQHFRLSLGGVLVKRRKGEDFCHLNNSVSSLWPEPRRERFSRCQCRCRAKSLLIGNFFCLRPPLLRPLKIITQ
jgi:hypothetical protein